MFLPMRRCILFRALQVASVPKMILMLKVGLRLVFRMLWVVRSYLVVMVLRLVFGSMVTGIAVRFTS